MEPTHITLDRIDESADEVQEEGVSNRQATVLHDPLLSTTSLPKEHGHSRSKSLDTNRLAGASQPSQSFGARFNKIPKSISTHKGTGIVDLTRKPVMGTFRLERPSRETQAQNLPPNSQDEHFVHSQVTTQRQDPQEWRKLPEPSQSGHSILPSQLARLPPLRNIVKDTESHQDQNFLQARYQSVEPSTGVIDAIANRTPLASMHFGGSGHESHIESRYVNLDASSASGSQLHQDLPNVHPAGNFIIRSDWYSGQETFGGYARREPAPHNLALQDPNSSERMMGNIDHDQAKIRKAYRQFKREQIEAATKQNQQKRQATAGQDENLQRPLLGNVQSYGPGIYSAYPVAQQAQSLGNLESGRNTPTPPGGFLHPHQYLLSPAPALSFPKSSPLTPSFLDPVLVPQTYEAMLQRYHQNKKVINRWIMENERYYADFHAKFQNQQKILGSVNSPYFPPNNDPRFGPPVSSNHTTLQDTRIRATQVPIYQAQEPPREPMPGLMAPPGPYYLNAESVRSHTISPQFGSRQNPPHVSSSLREVQNVRPSPPKSRVKHGSLHSNSKGRKPRERKGKGSAAVSRASSTQKDDLETHFPEEKDDPFEQIDPKQANPSGLGSSRDDEESTHDENPQTDMSIYADEIAAADLPPPTISDAALRAAGITPKPKTEVKLSGQAPNKNRRRERKTGFPSGGLRVSESLLPALIAGGAEELPSKSRYATTKATYAAKIGVSNAQDASSAVPALSSGPNRSQNEVEQQNPTNQSLSAAQFPEPSLRSGIPKGRDDRKASMRKENIEMQKAASERSSVSEAIPSSPEEPDDPKDRDYGVRTPGGRKAVAAGAANVEKGTSSRSNRNPSTPTMASTVPAKRRTSTAASESAGKRSRQTITLRESQEAERAVSEPPSSGAP